MPGLYCGHIDEALEAGANMIISHHPLIFKGIKQLCDVTPTQRP
jgi:putative NIF3 family GTP cyclohydrolase 1 type 2